MKVRGFTLIEMIVTIVIGSIIMLGIAAYLRLGVQGYSDSIARQRLQTQAQFAIEKMSREIRHAVPNSFEVTQGNSCISFFPIAMSGLYVRRGTNEIDFIVGNVDETGNRYDRIPENLRMIINPTHSADFYNSSDNMDVGEIEKSANVFTTSNGNAFSNDSVGNRFYLFHPRTGVRYCWDADKKILTRGNISTDKHGNDDMVNVATISDHVSSLTFAYEPRSLHSGGIVHINLEFEQNGESSVYQQDVQVLNVP
ncbi:type II secretion system protein [Vibrio sp. EA2]|uniref:PilW family protein n=1 Tax=Vibrio sp. EA2 TaxID=3079860 RepID=UPI00294969CB|nr:type II secretion system protein [Vibrio sp. EA2]MDV6253639.1 type II secretion system protein [Vibrio sp. EA2]